MNRDRQLRHIAADLQLDLAADIFKDTGRRLRRMQEKLRKLQKEARENRTCSK